MFQSHLDQSIAALHAVRSMENEVHDAARLMAAALHAGGRILTCGNGGSAAESAHFSTELLCRLDGDRPPLAAINLTADGSFLTATANDYQFDEVFARQIDGLGRAGDVLMAITTSGNSPNVLRALERARSRGLRSVALLGRDGGKAAPLADIPLIVPVPTTAHIQEAHLVLIHILCAQIESLVFGFSHPSTQPAS
jgi:D-sedoheptulose 7-phosphate isomerase